MTASSSTFPFPMQKENKWCFLQSFLQIDIISYRLSEFHYTYIVHLTKLSKIMARLGLYDDKCKKKYFCLCGESYEA